MTDVMTAAQQETAHLTQESQSTSPTEVSYQPQAFTREGDID